MTREATPENVKADFNDAVFEYQGISSRMKRRGDRYFMETVDPEWLAKSTSSEGPSASSQATPRREFSVDRLVGSHWFQQMLHKDEQGRYVRLPLAYHLVEQRWIHVNGAFLGPNPDNFFGKSRVWNETCVYCHNTRPSGNPKPFENGTRGYETEVGELGISCEACHGAGERHVQAHQEAGRRATEDEFGDPTIVNPARLIVARSVEVCGHCHGGGMPRLHAWNPETLADPFLAGQELKQFWLLHRSDAEMRQQAKSQGMQISLPQSSEPIDARFWGDGTPLTTALEYQGLTMSACYQNGEGKLTCLTCHSMHHGEPNHQLKDGMRSNEACYGCHDSFRARLAEHTHHPTDSSGSQCFNCHMPHQVYSLLSTHRSHRIAIPRVAESRGTGKPHACNLCHLDKSLGWTADQLAKWYGIRPEELSEDESSIASSVLHLTQSDARTRAVVAGAFGWPAAQEVSGQDWPPDLLIRALDYERYEAVRYSLHRALRTMLKPADDNYNYQGTEAERAAELSQIRRKLNAANSPDAARHPYVPLMKDGQFSERILDRLFGARHDPDVYINE